MTDARRTIAIALAAALVGSLVGAGVVGMLDGGDRAGPGPGTDAPLDADPTSDREDPDVAGGDGDLRAFGSAESFREYLEMAPSGGSGVYLGAGGRVNQAVETDDVATRSADAEMNDGGDGGSDGGGASGGTRHSRTNAQEAGIQEPDVVKTDGRSVYVAGDAGTHVLDVDDPADPAVVERVDAEGRMVLAGDRLVVFDDDRVLGYDVSDPDSPERTWNRSVNGSVETARLIEDTLYLVVREDVDRADPCPIAPLGEAGPPVTCDAVYRPAEPAPADVTYTALSLDPASGTVRDAVALVGSARTTAIYVTANGIYLTYDQSPSQAQIQLEYLLTEADDLLPEHVTDRLREIRSYDLSARATETEARVTIRRWLSSLSDERREAAQRRLRDGFENYTETRKRELVRTGIARIAIDGGSLSVAATGEVPGHPLNQFSMDEHEGRLRIATTVDAPGSDSENDLYVLDSSLSVVGSTKGMGITERIYSVRYVGDRAYVVTFRRIDPFHVVDLSDPTDPTVEGELKLPGFSSYLHPIGEDRVLGVGEEDGRVKLVVFDVSDPEDPTIADSRVLEARWSAISRTHHAFLQDEKHGVFFLPTSDGGQVYGYENGLQRVATVDTAGPARRALYVDDYLYVVGQSEVTVLDQTTWKPTTTVYLPL